MVPVRQRALGVTRSGSSPSESIFALGRLTLEGGSAVPKSPSREFRVHARHLDRHHARLVKEASFEAAAIAYAEHYPSVADDNDEISIIVQELESGHEHCFKIDLSTGETAPCG